MEEKTRGRCAACKIEGQGDQDFLCDECLNREGGMVYCRRCRGRIPLTLDELRSYASEVKDVAVPVQPGTVLVINACPACTPGGENQAGNVVILTARLMLH